MAKYTISIHAPLCGGRHADLLKIGALFISIHAPLCGGRHIDTDY